MLKNNAKQILLLSGLVLLLQACAPEEDIQDDPRIKFGGTWVVNETSSVFGPSAYQVTVSNHPDNEEQIQIANFYNIGAGTRVNANVNNNSLSILNQSVSGQIISGSGSFQNNTVTVNFTANDGQVNDNVTAQFTRP
ncbi:MAG: hypothetical protein ACK4GL_10505 [Flavobacteriales bacterium]